MPFPNVTVQPGRDSSHDVSLSNGTEKIGLLFRDGPRVLQEIPTSENARQFLREQKSWFSGMGRLRYEDDPQGYWDAYAVWAMTDGKLFPVPQWKWGNGLRSVVYNMPGDVDYQILSGNNRYISISFSGDAFALKNILLWLDWTGAPGALTYSLHSDSGGNPGTSLKSGTITTANATRYGPTTLTFSSAYSTSGSTTYHVKIYHAGDANNHWSVGVDADGAGSKVSANDSAWSAAAFSMYYRVTDVDVNRQFKMFDFREATYAVTLNADETSSVLYINGDRFKATSATSTTVVNTSSGVSTGWNADLWIGAYVRIIAGTGRGQVRQITDSDTTSLTVATWDKTPDTTSECVIYATPFWQPITSGLGLVTGDPVVTGDVVYFPQGATTIREMQIDYTNALQHAFGNNGSNTADLLAIHYNSAVGPEIWKADIDAATINHAPEVAFGAALVFSDDIKVGFPSSNITNMLVGNSLVIFKEDGLWSITSNYIPEYQNTGLASAKDPSNGFAAMFVNSELWWSWSHSVERLLADDITDMLNYRAGAQGLVRSGIPKDAVAGVGWKFFAIDGEGTNISSIICFNGSGWNEIFRGWRTGARIQNLFWQVCPGTRSRLWCDVNGELVYIEFPLFGANPRIDSGISYQHYAELETSTFDAADTTLYKFLNNVRVNMEAASSRVIVDYQADDDVGSNTWYEIGELANVQRDEFVIDLGEVQQWRLRFRMYTTTATSPPVINSYSNSGWVFQPLKYQWVSSFKVDSNQITKTGSLDFTPDKIVDYLQDAHERGSSLRLRSVIPTMDDKVVIVSAPVIHRDWVRVQDGKTVWGGYVDVSFREA